MPRTTARSLLEHLQDAGPARQRPIVDPVGGKFSCSGAAALVSGAVCLRAWTARSFRSEGVYRYRKERLEGPALASNQHRREPTRYDSVQDQTDVRSQLDRSHA